MKKTILNIECIHSKNVSRNDRSVTENGVPNRHKFLNASILELFKKKVPRNVGKITKKGNLALASIFKPPYTEFPQMSSQKVVSI